ncbi:sel1 repeat family protein [Streptomyces sp. DH18]|uniref:sel1 repeat family protein n=1 Tax=Streptomyces sp. DH18 TaxID=3040126 RepID=UPI0024418AB6|nr:sel1 repeat family protein [Streptomyces sp. DH18]MDG9687084.1 sel1 repeat family protein [Streptomyces sp. DH18]
MGVAGEREASDGTVVGVGNSVSGGVFHAPVVQTGTFSGGMHTYYGLQAPSGLPPVADWPQLDRADPIAFGVRRTRRIGDEPPLPTYATRDGDAVLKERVRTAARSGGLVLVTGEPLSGKSRTAWAAMLTTLPGTTRFLGPEAGTDLRVLPAVLRGRGEDRCVIWLDKLEGHLGEHGLTPALLAELVRLRVPVIATMSDGAYDAHRFGGQARARVLVGIDPVELSRAWTQDEKERLKDGAGGDLRPGDAYYWSEDDGIAAFLAVGPELWDEWWWARRPNAHPHGHLLVRVAMDLARCGTDDTAFPSALLRELCALYEQEAAQAAGEPFEDALAWASRIRHGVTGMLVPGTEPDTWRCFASLPRDAVSRPDTPPVPLGLWLHALEAVQGDPDLTELVVECAQSELERVADGRPEVGLVLGRLYEATGQAQYAEDWFRHSADAGGIEAAGIVGRALVIQGKIVEAVSYLERAAEAGDAEARVRLVLTLADRAVFWLDRLRESGDERTQQVEETLRTVTDPPPDTVEA